MLVYNTTYQVNIEDARNFVIWIHQCYIPNVIEFGQLKKPRLSRIISHKEEGSECFSLQFEVESSARLHHWYNKQGAQLNKELIDLFKEKVVAFTTLMDIIDES